MGLIYLYSVSFTDCEFRQTFSLPNSMMAMINELWELSVQFLCGNMSCLFIIFMGDIFFVSEELQKRRELTN